MYSKFVVGFTLLFSVQLGTALRHPQYLEAFHADNCTGNSSMFLETTFNITEELRNSTSLQGLWRYVLQNEFINITTTRRSFNGETNCRSVDGSVVHLKSVEKLAVGDLDDSVLTMYPKQMFEGEPVVVTEEGLSQIVNFSVSSYVFTGPQSFSIFEGENFSGNASCLEVEWPSRDDGYGVSPSWGFEAYPVKSAKLGCTGNEERRLSSDADKREVNWDSNGVLL